MRRKSIRYSTLEVVTQLFLVFIKMKNVKGGAQAHQLWTHDQKAYVEQERKKKENKANSEKNLGEIKFLYYTVG